MVILNLSGISDRKIEICLSRLSMLFLFAVLRSVAVADMAILRMASAINASNAKISHGYLTDRLHGCKLDAIWSH